jgi:predicted phosphodiesterase
MSPRPQFVVTTGDYMFATPSGSAGPAQIALYMNARRAYSGVVFSAMGNHECTGATASNCVGVTGNNNYSAFLSNLVAPLGKATPYYAVPVNDVAGAWTAKIVVVACNAWDATQRSWLQSTLAAPTTYTFVVRHEPSSAYAPCISDMNTLLAQNPYNILIVGHTHTYAATPSRKELLVGNGGAPSSTTLGYAIVEQTSAGFIATQYDYATAAPLGTATFP